MSINELLDLLRRLPPQNVTSNLDQIVKVLGGPSDEVADELLSSIDQPLKVLSDSSGREFLACDFNRDSVQDEGGDDAGDDAESADAFRSPWTNDYVPELPDGTKPSARLRVLEQAANDAFSIYREMYYEGTGVSSVYLWDLEDGSTSSFAGVVLLKKTTGQAGGDGTNGAWDSIHVFEVAERSRVGNYKLTSTVMLYMSKSGSSTLGDMELGGSMTRQIEQSFPIEPLPSSAAAQSTQPPFNPSHISNIGKMIEEQEIKMRNLLNEVYFAKTRDVVNELRSIRGSNEESKRKGLQGELVGLLRNRH